MTDRLSMNCRLALTKTESNKTSNEIGLAYTVPPVDFYDKKEAPRMTPLYQCRNPFTHAGGYLTTYGTTYENRPSTKEATNKAYKYPKLHTELVRPGKMSLLKPALTEYMEQYPVKDSEAPRCQPRSVDKLGACPIITTGRDDREPADLKPNITKHLDIYVSTARMAHRHFNRAEQQSYQANKNVVTFYDAMDIAKQKGFGPKLKTYIDFELERREKPMIDKAVFKTKSVIRNIPKMVPRVPNFGMETEAQTEFSEPTGFVKANLFKRMAEYPEVIVPPTVKQGVSAPAMYTSEQDSIHRQKSPQAVV